jgi:type I restriction enzyme R subunit
MLVCIDKITAVRMHKLIEFYWCQRVKEVEKQIKSTLYLDKPLKAHTLMQAIARANRVKEGKNNGLIVDYCGILKSLRKALATFAIESGGGNSGPGGTDPVKPQEELIAELAEAIGMVKAFLQERAFQLSEIISKTGFERIAAVSRARETINKSEETRKRFEILTREIFKKFKACLTIPEINDYKDDYDAIDIIYKKLQDDKKKADITDIIRVLHDIVDDAIQPKEQEKASEEKIYDISKIDFDSLRREFEKSPRKNTAVQCLKNLIEERLKRMIARNPLRTDLYRRYQEVINEYNTEKDRVVIEKTQRVYDHVFMQYQSAINNTYAA